MQPRTPLSLKSLSRIAGLLYLIVIAGGLFAEAFVREALLVPHNHLATATNIQTHEMLYRYGFLADLLNFICGVPVIIFLFSLLYPNHKRLTLLALFFVIISNAIFATNITHQLEPLLILTDKTYTGLQPGQLADLSVMALEAQSQGYAIGLVFFGAYCIVIGYCLVADSLLPKILGIGYAIAGTCYIANSLIMFCTPGFHNPLFPYILFPGFLGELAVCLWLLIPGIKKQNSPMSDDKPFSTSEKMP